MIMLSEKDYGKIAEITSTEGLEGRVTKYLISIRDTLVSRGFSDVDAEKAIAGALPYCIFQYAQLIDLK